MNDLWKPHFIGEYWEKYGAKIVIIASFVAAGIVVSWILS